MAIELLLLEDVDHLGRSGDIVAVKSGFARNFLVPQKRAVVATVAARRMQQRLKEERAKLAIIDRQDAEEAAARLQHTVLRTEVKVDQDGKMYGSVSALDIVHLLSVEGIAVEKRYVKLPAAIKKTGTHTIEFVLKEGVTASCKLKIVPEGQADVEEEVVVVSEAPAAE